MKPRHAADAGAAQRSHELHGQGHDHKHAHGGSHDVAHHKGRTFRPGRNPPRPPAPPRRPAHRQRMAPAAQQTELNNDSDENQRVDADADRMLREQMMSKRLQDDSDDLHQGDDRGQSAHEALYKWQLSEVKLPPGRPGPKHGEGLDERSPEVALLRRAAAEPHAVRHEDCAVAITRALLKNSIATKTAGSAAPGGAAANPAVLALELGSTYLRIGVDPDRFGTLRQVRDALVLAQAATPAAARSLPSEAQQNRHLLLPLALLSLGRPRTPDQLNSVLARRANAAESMHALKAVSSQALQASQPPRKPQAGGPKS